MYKKILITGANGFLGTNVVRHFDAMGVATRVLVRNSNETLDELQSCEVVKGSVMSESDMASAAVGCDAIVHICAITDQACPQYSKYRDFNVGALSVAIEAARGAGIKRLVFVSSANTIGNGESLSAPADETKPISSIYRRQNYARSKVEAEALLFAAHDIEGVVVNPCFMIGGYDKGPSSGELITRAYGKKFAMATRGGKNVVDVEYAAEAVCNAVERGRSGERYLLAGENVSYSEFYRMLGEVDGVKKCYIGMPLWVLLLAGYPGDLLRALGVRCRVSSRNVRAIAMKESYSGAKAERELGLKKTDVKKSIEKAVKWFKMKKMLSLLIVGSLSVVGLRAQSADVSDYGKITVGATDDYFDMVHAFGVEQAQEAYEKFVGEFIVPNDSAVLDTKGHVMTNEDKIYDARLRMMATEIQLPYNQEVRKAIERFTTRGGVMEYVLGRGRYYFPIFEQALYDHGLPLELKMLPVIESALIPVARSYASAVGLWQIMMATGKAYGLEINSFVDERQDPVKSTNAACLFLKDLYKIYGDWTLVIAAYNCGPGRVNSALRRAGNVDSYWDIWNYLPRETRNYVPAFIGASYGYTFYKANEMTPREVTALSVDTVMVNKMMHFSQISTTIPVTIDELRTLNPQYRIDILPALDKQYALVLPTDKIDDYIDNEALIYSKDTTYLKKYLQIKNLTPEKAQSVASHSYASGKKMIYRVKSGDNLGAIARRYHVKVKDIQRWNNLRGTNIRIGQRLTLYPR